LAVKFFDKTQPGCGAAEHDCAVHRRILDPSAGAFLFDAGDRVGRKYTFLITLTGMGLGSGVIGLIPSYQSIVSPPRSCSSPCRMIQGLCLGGEYGGAITYVAEHVSTNARLLHRLAANLSDPWDRGVDGRDRRTRAYVGTDAFNDWGWRIPFLASFLLVAIAIYIRLQLQETPIFQELKAPKADDQEPWKEASSARISSSVVIASIV